MNFIDVIILIFVILFVGLILFFNIKNKLKGKNSCSKCPYSNKCEKCTIKDEKKDIKDSKNINNDENTKK